MKTYFYTYRRYRQTVCGNPSHFVTVYRIKRNIPVLLATRVEVGYYSTLDAVRKTIERFEKFDAKKAHRAGKISIMQLLVP